MEDYRRCLDCEDQEAFDDTSAYGSDNVRSGSKGTKNTIPIPVKLDRQGHSRNFHTGFGPHSSCGFLWIPVDCEVQEAFDDASAYGSDNVQATRARKILFLFP